MRVSDSGGRAKTFLGHVDRFRPVVGPLSADPSARPATLPWPGERWATFRRARLRPVVCLFCFSSLLHPRCGQGIKKRKLEERRIERRTASMRDQMINAKEELYH
jgi:hypothetical protein